MKRTTFTIAVMALAVLIAACGAGPAGGADLQDTRWVLVTLEGESPLPDRAPSAEFAEDQVSGSTGCNTYFSTYEVDGDELTIGTVAVTEMWCMEPEGVMDQEQAFLAALASVTSYRLAGERLELLDDTGQATLTFESRAAEE